MDKRRILGSRLAVKTVYAYSLIADMKWPKIMVRSSQNSESKVKGTEPLTAGKGPLTTDIVIVIQAHMIAD